MSWMHFAKVDSLSSQHRVMFKLTAYQWRILAGVTRVGLHLQLATQRCPCSVKAYFTRAWKKCTVTLPGIVWHYVSLILSLALAYLHPGVIAKPLLLRGSRRRYSPKDFQNSQHEENLAIYHHGHNMVHIHTAVGHQCILIAVFVQNLAKSSSLCERRRRACALFCMRPCVRVLTGVCVHACLHVSYCTSVSPTGR